MIELHIGLTRVCLRGPGSTESMVPAPGELDACVKHCLGAVKRPALRLLRPRVTAYLSSALARPFLIGPVAGLASWTEAAAFAAAAAPAATGHAGECQVELESWPGDGPALAIAVAKDTLRQIDSGVRAAGFRLVSIRPAWAPPLNDLGRKTAGVLPLTVLEDDDGTVLVAAPRRDVQLAMGVYPPPAADQLGTLMARMALSQDLGSEAPILRRWDAAPTRGWESEATGEGRP